MYYFRCRSFIAAQEAAMISESPHQPGARSIRRWLYTIWFITQVKTQNSLGSLLQYVQTTLTQHGSVLFKFCFNT